MKTPEIHPLGGTGLALSHDFATKVTSVLVHGPNALELRRDERFRVHTLSARFKRSLESTMPLWTHPLLPPVILLHDNLSNLRQFSRDMLKQESEKLREQLTGRGQPEEPHQQHQQQGHVSHGKESEESQRHTDLEKDLETEVEMEMEKMAFNYESIANLLGGKNDDEHSKLKRARFINSLNDLLTTAIGIRQALEWDRRFATFLLGVWDEVETLRSEANGKTTEQSQRKTDLVGRQVKELIRNLDNSAGGFEAGVQGVISSLEVQLNMVGGAKTTRAFYVQPDLSFSVFWLKYQLIFSRLAIAFGCHCSTRQQQERADECPGGPR